MEVPLLQRPLSAAPDPRPTAPSWSLSRWTSLNLELKCRYNPARLQAQWSKFPQICMTHFYCSYICTVGSPVFNARRTNPMQRSCTFCTKYKNGTPLVAHSYVMYREHYCFFFNILFYLQSVHWAGELMAGLSCLTKLCAKQATPSPTVPSSPIDTHTQTHSVSTSGFPGHWWWLRIDLSFYTAMMSP